MEITLTLEMLFQLFLATVLGLAIGFEREIKKKPLGFRTCLVISISSCMLTIVSIESAYMFTGSVENVNVNVDPLRLAAQIVTGVGFICAGVIIKNSNDVVTGLTTAAMIWGASGIGIAIGAGFYFVSIIVVAIILAGVELFPLFFAKIGLKKLGNREVILHLNLPSSKEIKDFCNGLEEHGIRLMQMKIIQNDNFITLHMRVSVSFDVDVIKLYQKLESRHEVSGVTIEIA